MNKKRILKFVGISLAVVAVVAVVFVIAPQISMADNPQDKLCPVYPTETPPSEPPAVALEIQGSQATSNEHSQGYHRCGDCFGDGERLDCHCFYSIWDPYKSGTSAKGKARTTTDCPAFNAVGTDVWLWKWVDDEWVEVAHGYYSIYIPPATQCIAYATYSNAESAYYINTSRHSVYHDSEPFCFEELESDYVWLTFN